MGQSKARDNNFNLIRFLASFMVLLSHSFGLTTGERNAEPLRRLLGVSFGDVAVDIFFITSGFLIAGSYLSRKSLVGFVRARFLRIYPALIVAVLFCALVVGVFFTAESLREYFGNPQTYKFMLKNSTLVAGVEYRLPGVFLEHSHKAVNGALWTLPYEVAMYAALVAVFSLMAFLRLGRSALLFVAAIAVAANAANHFVEALPQNPIRLFSMFFCGAAFFVWWDRVRMSSRVAMGLLAFLCVSMIHQDAFFVVYCLVLPYLVLAAAYIPAGRIRAFNKGGDYSYGMYIYGFPVQQSVVGISPGISVPAMLLASFVATLGLAVLSWHALEKKALRLKA